MRALWFVLAGCVSAPAPAPPPNLDAMSTNAATCPKEAPKVPNDLPGAADWCLPLQAPNATRWWYSAPQYNLMLDGTGKVLYRLVLQSRRTHRMADPHAADLDNDGVDELIYQRTASDDHGLTLIHLEVVSFQDPADPSGDQIQIGGSGKDSCRATWKLVDREGGGKDIAVTGDCDKEPGRPDGAHTITYRLNGSSLDRVP